MDSSIVVVSNMDGKKYKMVMKGDVAMLSVDKIKRYLHDATKLEPSRQLLRFNNATIADGMIGSQIGLYDGAVLFLDVAPLSFPAQASSSASNIMTPAPTVPVFQHPQQTPQHSFQNLSAMTIAPSPIVGGRSGSTGGGMVVAPVEYGGASVSRPRWSESTIIADNRHFANPTAITAADREQRQRSEERRYQLEHDMESELTKLREMQRKVETERADMLRRENERLQQLRAREDDLEREAEHIRDERRRLDITKASMEQEASRSLREADNLSRRQQQEIEALQRELIQARTNAAAARTASQPPPQPVKLQPEERVARSLEILAQDFRLPRLTLDANYTCIINLSSEKVNLLVTFDPSTHRLFLYSTILSSLPSDAMVALRLYEAVLEGALLGRDMAGGGIGISAKNNLLLMSTSLDMRHADEHALVAVARPFVCAVQKWVDVVNGILRSHGISP
jgi:hypothetical protein